MGESSVHVIDHPNGKIAQIEGVIDGSFDLRQLMGDHEIVMFDLDAVSRITSFGVREWRTSLSGLDARYKCFVRCRPSLVAQFNLVPGFACGGELVSFYLPYICPDCDHVIEALLDLRGEDSIIESLKLPEIDCPECGTETEFDDIPTSYLKYARSVPRPRPPAAASAMIDGKELESPRREFTARKEVEDTVTAFWLSGYLDNRRHLKRLAEGAEGQVVVHLGDLDEVNDDGLKGLAEFLGKFDRVWLCRVPEALLDPLVTASSDLNIVSVQADIQCTRCNNNASVELDAARLAALADDTVTQSEHCPHCSRALSFEPARLESLGRRALADPPDAVRIHLLNQDQPQFTTSGSHTYAGTNQLLFGKYRVLRQLGEGGMGVVLLARYMGAERFEKLVVLKRIRPDRLRRPGAAEEFTREARLTARLTHPNVVQIYDFSRYEGEYFLAMEYVNGIDLRKALKLSRKAGLLWPINLCLRVIHDLCAALEAAHDYRDDDALLVPIIHRDVSPENVIISVNGEIKLTDFGVAKAADSSVNTDAGVFKGKHAYSAPEQLEADLTADHRCDIYSVGVVMYELLTVRRYMSADVTAKTIYAHLMKPPPVISQARSDVPAGLQQLFERAVDKDLRSRFQTAGDMRTAIEEIIRRGAWPTAQDLAGWIRKVMTLERETAGAGPPREKTETTGNVTVRETPSDTENETNVRATVNGADDE